VEKEKIRLNDSEIVEKGIKIEQRKSSKKEVSSNGRDSLKGIDKMSIYRYPFFWFMEKHQEGSFLI